MIVSKQLEKKIIAEIAALIFLIFVIIYGIFAIGGKSNDVKSQNGIVMIMDTSNFKSIEASSDGVGLESKGIKYTVTNNNGEAVSYKLILKLNKVNKELIKKIRISTDDLYIEDLTKLDKVDDGYVVATGKLNSGYTKIHLIKMWYALDTEKKLVKDMLDYEFVLVEE